MEQRIYTIKKEIDLAELQEEFICAMESSGNVDKLMLQQAIDVLEDLMQTGTSNTVEAVRERQEVIERLTAEGEQLVEKIRGQNSEIIDLKKKLELSESKYERCIEIIEDARRTEEELKQKLHTLEREKSTYINYNEFQKTEIKELKVKLSSAERENKIIKKEIEKIPNTKKVIAALLSNTYIDKEFE